MESEAAETETESETVKEVENFRNVLGKFLRRNEIFFFFPGDG